MGNPFKTIAVIGAGTMGQGIAQVCAGAGYITLLYDVNQHAAEGGVDAIRKNVGTLVGKGKVQANQNQLMTDNLRHVAEPSLLLADLIIEAVVEKLEIKQKLFETLEQINNGRAILATNTSSLSVRAIAAKLKDPSKCVGIHFFNPAPVMKLVELIPGKSTDSGVIDDVKNFLLSAGKQVVMSADSPGFIVNRVARHFYLEALRSLEEGAAPAADIDALLRSSGFKMGPFELMDLIGIDINYAVSLSVYNAFNQEARFKPSPLQEQKVKEGTLGRKSGRGFYDY